MFNRAAVKKWKRSVAWFPSYTERNASLADAERKFSRKCMFLDSWKTLKTAVVKAGAYIVSIDKKTTVYKLEAWEIAFFETRALAVQCPQQHAPVFH